MAVFPLYFQPGFDKASADIVEQFAELSLYYSAPVLPFLFIAFVLGWTWMSRIKFYVKYPLLKWGIITALIFVNAFNLRPEHFKWDDLKTIDLAKKIPPQSSVVTQGHLLPYVGYRAKNFYLAPHFEKNPESKDAFTNPDYYLFDFEANAYPLSAGDLRQKAEELKANGRYKISHEDERRLVLKRE